MPPFLSTLLELKDEFNVPLYIAGGFVRDLLLERQSFDLDLVIEGEPFLFGQRFARETGGRFVILILDQATVNIDLFQDGAHWDIDISQMRGGSITEDLIQRDFTINAMAISVDDIVREKWQQFVIDPLNGKLDLKNREIKAVSKDALVKDPFRLLRGVRFSSKLGFTLEKYTKEVFLENKTLLRNLRGERLKVELGKLLAGDAVANFKALEEIGFLQQLFYDKALEDSRSFVSVLQSLEDLFLKEGLLHNLINNRLFDYFNQNNGGWNKISLLKMAALLCTVFDYKVFGDIAGNKIKPRQKSVEGKANKKHFLQFCAALGFNKKEQKFIHRVLWFYKIPMDIYRKPEKTGKLLHNLYKLLRRETPAVLVFSLAAYTACPNHFKSNLSNLPSVEEYEIFILNLLHRFLSFRPIL